MSQTERYVHSVRLEEDKCQGCTNCLKRCPTEAIRIRNNKATIIRANCIDCGECVRVCPHHAKVAVTDPVSIIERFEHRIALPAPALYVQFQQVHHAERVIASLYKLGFDEVFEVARAAEVISYAISRTLINEDRPRPVISSARIRLKENCWQRLLMVAGTLWISVVARINSRCAGGSSRIWSSALNAWAESI